MKDLQNSSRFISIERKDSEDPDEQKLESLEFLIKFYTNSIYRSEDNNEALAEYFYKKAGAFVNIAKIYQGSTGEEEKVETNQIDALECYNEAISKVDNPLYYMERANLLFYMNNVQLACEDVKTVCDFLADDQKVLSIKQSVRLKIYNWLQDLRPVVNNYPYISKVIKTFLDYSYDSTEESAPGFISPLSPFPISPLSDEYYDPYLCRNDLKDMELTGGSEFKPSD